MSNVETMVFSFVDGNHKALEATSVVAAIRSVTVIVTAVAWAPGAQAKNPKACKKYGTLYELWRSSGRYDPISNPGAYVGFFFARGGSTLHHPRASLHAAGGGMKKLIKNPLVVAGAVLILTAITLRYMSGPPVCRDGWQSSSIGTRGACSHHGGVRHGWGGIVAIILAIVAGFARYAANQDLSDTPRTQRPPPRPPIAPPQATAPSQKREPSADSIEAMQEGEAKTKAYLNAYFAEPSPRQGRNKRRLKRPRLP
ncbi:hypothetical protein EM858_04335 [Agrobacterium sp. CNPSo 2736]|uniref:hypothetical protein n=1 Tax=Agrobacterium sp. CNPSo 2736 TaxID=2499627 RepID=UPI000FDB2A69|nr:hypothetical protein [Agrobacterium sp. CNPSo 2736]RVT80230.1 hypothetical protein EM858_04335 [Agrobacterium sp. CNPSo 2736]